MTQDSSYREDVPAFALIARNMYEAGVRPESDLDGSPVMVRLYATRHAWASSIFHAIEICQRILDLDAQAQGYSSRFDLELARARARRGRRGARR